VKDLLNSFRSSSNCLSNLGGAAAPPYYAWVGRCCGSTELAEVRNAQISKPLWLVVRCRLIVSISDAASQRSPKHGRAVNLMRECVLLTQAGRVKCHAKGVKFSRIASAFRKSVEHGSNISGVSHHFDTEQRS
jgi:hypothetical protein